MFDEYKNELLQFYNGQKTSNQLSAALENPNRLKLKREFLKIYATKNSEADSAVIRRFFDPTGKYEDPLESIDRFELDRLRPLINFMTRGTMLRDDAPVFALAWLLEFTPYTAWKEAKQRVEMKPLVQAVADLPNTGQANGEEPKNDGEFINNDREIGNNEGRLVHPHKLSQRFIYLATALLLTISIGLSWLYIIPANINHPTPDQKCMYWDGDRYVPTTCDINVNRTTVPLDLRRLTKLKKIRWPDLLTKKDVGKVWYIRNDGQYEFFTDSGIYPVDPEKRLRPLSAYILSNHVSYYRFILQILYWSIIAIVLLVIIYIRVKKLLPKLSFRLNKPIIATEFNPQPQNLHGSA
jgi:hypothetical protein